MSNAEKPAPKFTLKLTREMRMAIVVLGFAGALGGWFVYNTSQTPSTLDLTQEPLASAPQDTPQAGTVVEEPANASPGINVESPTRPVTTPEVPFLTPNQPVVEPEPEPSTVVTPAPTVRAQNLPNPFRPLTLPTPAASAPAEPAPASPVRPPTPPRPVQALNPAPPVPRPSTLAGPTIPNLAGPVSVRPPSISGVMPLPVVPGTGMAGYAPAPVVPAQSAPPVVPTPSVRAPAGSALAVTTPARDGQSTGRRAQPAAPEVLRALQVDAAPTPGASAEQTGPGPQLISPLDAYVANEQVRYSAVVLGPVNTSIFQTRSGYVVVTLGQRLPDSEILVKDISSTSVTLALGDQLKTLEIDKR